MNIRLLYRKALERWREDTFRGLYRAATKRLTRATTDPFDLRYGTNTSGLVPIWMLSTTSPNAVFGYQYEATDSEELERAVGLLGEDLATFTFVDLGCGKGRTLIVASRLGFGKVVGVEFGPELAAIARRNLAKLGLTGVHVVQGDVADLRFPNSDLVVFMFNPFSEEVMRKVVANLRAYEGRKLYVIYNCPKYAEIVDSSGFLDRFGGPLATRFTMQIWKKATLETNGN